MTIELDDDAALVLFDLLNGYGENDDGRTLAIRNAAERNSLWSLASALEKSLVAQFQPDYVAQLERARARAEERAGSW
jgi:hypothetical protein